MMNAVHIMRCYRAYLLGKKRVWGTARGLVHYKKILQAYLAAKRVVVRDRRS